jgi:hypothetical protein
MELQCVFGAMDTIEEETYAKNLEEEAEKADEEPKVVEAVEEPAADPAKAMAKVQAQAAPVDEEVGLAGFMHTRKIRIHRLNSSASPYARVWVVDHTGKHAPEIRTQSVSRVKGALWEGPWEPRMPFILGSRSKVEVTAMNKNFLSSDSMLGYATVQLRDEMEHLRFEDWTEVSRELVLDSGAVVGMVTMELRWIRDGSAPAPLSDSRPMRAAATFGRSEFRAAMKHAEAKPVADTSGACRVRVRNVHVEGLKDADGPGSKADPYMKIRFEGDDEASSGPELVTKPKANVSEMTWAGPFTPEGLFVLGPGSTVSGSVWDKDKTSADDLLGRFRFDLGEHEAELRGGEWVLLASGVVGGRTETRVSMELQCVFGAMDAIVEE